MNPLRGPLETIVSGLYDERQRAMPSVVHTCHAYIPKLRRVMRAHYGNGVSATADRIMPGSYRYFRAVTLLCSSRVAPADHRRRARLRKRRENERHPAA